MSTAISTVTENVIDYPALRADSRQLRIIEANTEGEPLREQDLTRVKTPTGGGTTWQVDVNGNVTQTDEIIGLCVGIFKRGYLWQTNDPTDEKPIVVTNDLLVGYRVSDEIGPEIDPEVLERFRIGDRRYDWPALSDWNGPFGKSSKGGGKRVKEHRILAILRNGDVWPVLVNVGPGSLADVLPFLKKLPSFHYECELGLKLSKDKSEGGIAYSKIVPRVVGTISEEQGEIARRVYVEPLKKVFNEPPIRGLGPVVDAEAADDTPF